MHDLDKYHTDYFSYLEAPENATRYTPAIDQLRRFHHPMPLRVLDLGCGAAVLARYLVEDDTYTGVDHDPAALALARVRNLRPHVRFHQADTAQFLDERAGHTSTWNVVVLAGVVFHHIDTRTGGRHDDRAFLARCLDVLQPAGHLVIIAPFAYTDDERSGLFARARWKRSIIAPLLDGLAGAHLVTEITSRQLGLERHLAAQAAPPNWFVSDAAAVPTSAYHGHYLATLTLIMEVTRR
ncbi:MAG: class I SAM-dependent methyltransferase [Pseudonocardiaceae bacterium]